MDDIIIGAMLDIPVSRLSVGYKELLEDLTVSNPKYAAARIHGKGFVSKSIPKKLHFFKINDQRKSIIVPRCIDSKYYRGKPDTSIISDGKYIGFGAGEEFKLRDIQQNYFDTVVNPYITSFDKSEPISVLLNAECGSGKTVMSLYLAHLYRRKTIVVVPQTKLGKQFKARVSELFPKWSCGWEDGKNSYDITLATYSLLTDSRFDMNYFSQFGHIIFDEFHRCGADSYKDVLEKANCKYRTSLTATFRRKDGLADILKLHVGDILEMESNSIETDIYPITTKYSINEEEFRSVGRFGKLTAKVKLYSDIQVRDRKTKQEVTRGSVIDKSDSLDTVTVKSSIDKSTGTYSNKDFSFFPLGSVSMPTLDTEIAKYAERNNEIMDTLVELYKSGRKVLLLSKRKDQIFKLYGKLKRRGIQSGVVISEKAKEYKAHCKKLGMSPTEYSEHCLTNLPILLGIDKLAEEGLDVPEFDTIIYAHPIRDIEQSVGRVGRHLEGKKKPKAIFFLDKVPSYIRVFDGKTGAKQMFVSLGHKVHPYTNSQQFIQILKSETNGKI